MGPTGRLVTIKRSGVDGPHFPLSLSTCLFGRGIECDIRIQLPVVSKQHCKIEISGQEAVLFNFSSTNPTQVNGSVITEPVRLTHGDVITVVDRSFRYENESHQNRSESAEFTGQKRKQESLHRVSRSGFTSDPDGKVQESDARSKLCEENVSGSPLGHVRNGKAAGTVSGGPEDHAARKTINAVCSSELPRENYRNAMDPTAGDFKEGSSVPLVSCHGELKSFPSTWHPENSENHESPFRKLYESMKEEFDVKSEKGNVLQSGKKSGSPSHRASENECSGGLQDGTQVLVSVKSRPRSGRFAPVKADPALGEQGASQTEGRRKDEEALQTPKETMGPSVPPKEMTGTRTMVQHSPHNAPRKRRSEDMGVPSGSESVNLDQREGFGTDNKTFPPRKFLARNQTPTRVENDDNFGAAPEKCFSKKRGSVPTSVDILTTELETQNHAVLAPLSVQVERKIQSISVHQPEKVGTTTGHSSSGFPGRSSVDSNNFGDSINKIEGTPLKRRRVSFGGCLKPELFDENLPPNTPLKRGETPRSSLASHTPPVLKKIIKEYPQPSRKEDSSEICLEVTAQDQCKGSPAQNPTQTSPVANDARRRSCKVSSVSSGSKSHHTDIPKRGGRKSGTLPSKRTSIDRSQHEILQRIFSKRRSGASEANLIVAKSWADVVKLGAKQTQARVVKHGPQRQLSKRQRRMNTPKKAVSDVHNQFSTGHANSPCTIIIGKAHIEKVNVPARPYRMLNSFVFNKKMDFNEDLSGLTEMFKTPAKVKPQIMSPCPNAFSNSEDFLGKKFQVPNSGEKPLLCTSETFGENVFPMTQNAPREPSDQRMPASPALRRPAIRVNTNIEKTRGSEAEPLKAALSANRFRRSSELRNTQMPGPGHRDKEANTDPAENTSGRHLRKTPQRGQKPEGATEEQESCFEACEKAIKSEDSSENTVAVRRSRRYSEQKWEPIADLTTLKRQQDTEPKEDLGGIQGLPQAPTQAQETMDVGNKTAEKCQKSLKPELVGMPTRMNIQLKTSPQKVDLDEEPSTLRKSIRKSGGSIPSHGEPGDGDEDITLLNRTPKQTLDSAENVTGSKRRSRTPKRNAQSLEDLTGLRELFQTPNHTDKPRTDSKTTKVPRKSPLAEPVNTPTSWRRQLKTSPQKVDIEEEPSTLRRSTRTPGESTQSHGEQGNGDEDIKLFKEAPKQTLDSAENITGSKRQSRTPKRNAQSLEDLAGLRELFQSPEHTQDPVTDDKTTKVPWKSPLADPVNTPTSKRRQLKTPLQKVDLEKDLRKPTQTPGESTHSHREPAGGDEDTRLFHRTPKQTLDSAENVTGSKRRSRTPKRNAQSLEDLAGLRELFQTPNHTDKPRTDSITTKVPCQSPLAEPVNTPTSRKRQLETPLQKVDIEEEPLALGKPTGTPKKTVLSYTEPGGGDEDIKLSKETPEKKLDCVENLTGSKKRKRRGKEKAQFLEDMVGFKELFQTPEHTKEPAAIVKTAIMPGRSPLAETVTTPTHMKRRLKIPLGKVDVAKELSPLTEPIQMPGEATHTHREPGGADAAIRLFKETPKQKLDSAENVTGSKRRSRAPKKMVCSLEDLVGLKELFQTPEHTPDPVTDDKTTTVPCKSPAADPVNKPTSRRLKTSPQQADVKEEPSALGKSTRTCGGNAHSHREPGGADDDIKLLKKTAKQTLSPAENVMLRKNRLRAPKETAQPLEDLASFKESSPVRDHSKEPGKAEGNPKDAPEQTPGRRKPATVLQRGLRARRVRAVADLQAHREPIESGSEGGVSLPSKRKQGTEEGSAGAKRLRSVTPAQGAAEGKPAPKRRRRAPTEGCDPPEPPTAKKRLRVVAERMELLGDRPRSSREIKTRGREAGRTTPPHQGMSLRSRRPNKTEAEEERPEPVITAAEKPKTKRSDKKPLKMSQETTLQSPEDQAKNSTSGGKAHESRMCLRSARLGQMPSPDIAKEKQREKRVGVSGKKQEEEVRQPSDPMCLRSRKITVPTGGNASESEPQQRVTRSAKRCAENIKKDNDNGGIKKLRTRSHRDNEDI
ncbi:proliferation marker protein Ki-67 [Eumetopias jubatus]|uniref:proliferation marker protein Ki-67 n=1 Tax=Eumetopias jubatus TaxID=34886 RepID=UPI001016E7AF|nr:proliferation marker protein Ki-67 [Eumetopias jubatus]